VAFTDDDVRVHPRWLWSLGHRFASDPGLDAVTGLVLPDELETDAQLLFEQSGSGPDRGYRPVTFRLADRPGSWLRQLFSVPTIERHEPGMPVSTFPFYATGELGIGSNMAFRTRAVQSLGGFDYALGVGTATCGGEDLAMLLQLLLAGRVLGYEPSAIVHHTHRRTLEDLEVQLQGYGVGFSAMVLSLILRDPRRMRAFAAALPRGLRAMMNPESTKRSGRDTDYPKVLSRAELRGMLAGPAAYLRERRVGRRIHGKPETPDPDKASHVDPSAPITPVKVVVVDEERRPTRVSMVHPAGGRYAAVWMLVRRSGRPAGMAKINVPDGDLTAALLDPAIDRILAAAPALPPVVLKGEPPLISIVVPTVLKRLDELRLCVESLLALDYPRLEILIVDNRPDPVAPVPEWLAAPNLRVLSEPHPGISSARNCGIAAATGSIVAFTDDDVVVDPGWAGAIAGRFESHPDEQAVAGMVLPRELETSAQQLLEEYYGGFGPRVFQPVSHRLRRIPTRAWNRPTAIELDESGNEIRSFSMYAAGTFGAGANMAFRTDALEAVGGFDTRLGIGTPTQGGEDLAMFVRLIWSGASTGFEPAALAHHLHRGDHDSLRRQIKGYGTGYTAMMLSLVASDRRHLGAMLATVPTAAKAFVDIFGEKARTGSSDARAATPNQPDPIPGDRSALARSEILGMATGPVAYARARRKAAMPHSRLEAE
jgi:cellulose synthase/poly-beta-1,6-N-acetylglucosamine synthase-like glycosyltransferase